MFSSPRILLVTPTYPRRHRRAYLLRCIKTFRRLTNCLWIVVEDSACVDPDIAVLLRRSGIPHVYLSHGPTRCWGNAQRNAALCYISENALDGIVYLADDDNLYRPRLFDEIRKTRFVSLFPVGHLGPDGIERPTVKNGKIVGWNADWTSRKYPVDMAAFAFDSGLLARLGPTPFDYGGRGGETELLEKLLDSQDQFELLCDECSKCYVWHDHPLRRPIWFTRLTRLCRQQWARLRGRVSSARSRSLRGNSSLPD